jgi:hypothetical protein
MRLADLTAAVHAAFDPDAAMTDVAEVSGHDRYQASAGISAASAYVAERAEAAGLTDVTVLRFPADGAPHWWTYRAPLPWTPVRASLSCAGHTLIRYPEHPYTLAANSAATPPGGRIARCVRWSAVRDGADPAGALVVADVPAPLPAVIGALTAAGAVAVAMDVIGSRPGREPGQVGRIELPPGSALAAFSLTADQLAWLITAADRSATAVVEVQIDPTDHGVRVVTARLPGGSEDELLLTAHLCHPRPGANDNASGVAALLGVARVLAAMRAGSGPDASHGRGLGRPGVRFVWGPEFVGVAAYLHDIVHAGLAAPPVIAVNVDMAGQDVPRCGGPLVIERGPDDLPSFLPALAERCAALLPPVTRSYSGAVPCDPWTWRATPFAGASDHALVADAPTRCPAIALGHWPDRLNHSSADTLGAVDPVELRRTAAIAGAAVAAVRGRTDPDLAGDVAEATVSWAAEHILAALPGRRQPPGQPRRQAAGQGVLDPLAEPNAWRLLEHRAGTASGAVLALDVAGVAPAQRESAARWVDSIAAAARDRLAGGHHGRTPVRPPTAADPDPGPDPGPGPAGTAAEQPGLLTGGGPLRRCWAGPVNLRALAEAAAPADRTWLDDQLAQDRGGGYARAIALLLSVNGKRDRQAMAWWAALSSELPLAASFAARFTDLICRAGWAAGPQDGGC